MLNCATKLTRWTKYRQLPSVLFWLSWCKSAMMILTLVVADLRRKRLVILLFPFPPLSLSSVAYKSRSLVKFNALFSGPHGRFLLVGCDSYITPLVTRTSSCFLQLRLKVNLSGGGALQHPVLCIQCTSETHTGSLSLSFARAFSMSLTRSVPGRG